MTRPARRYTLGDRLEAPKPNFPTSIENIVVEQGNRRPVWI
jgi:hypothetical protein